MSVTKTLENMQTALDNAYDSIEEIGGEVPQSRNMVNLSGTIEDLNNSVIAGVRGTNDAYQPTGKSYTKGEACIYNNIVYTAKVPIAAPAGEFDPSKWDESSLASLMNGVNANADAISSLIKTTSLDLTTNNDGYCAYRFDTPIRILSVFLKGRNGTNVNGWMVGFSMNNEDYMYRQYYFPIFDNTASSFGSRDVTLEITYQDIV